MPTLSLPQPYRYQNIPFENWGLQHLYIKLTISIFLLIFGKSRFKRGSSIWTEVKEAKEEPKFVIVTVVQLIKMDMD